MKYFYTNIKDKTRDEVYQSVSKLIDKFSQYVNFDNLMKEVSLYLEQTVVVVEQHGLWLIPENTLSQFGDAISIDE